MEPGFVPNLVLISEKRRLKNHDKNTMRMHPARIISDAHKDLGTAQDHIRQRKHKKTLKKIRQQLNKILDS